jgi:sodium transport system ATP-binding protein
MREAERLCDRIAILHRGRMLTEGAVDELRHRHGQTDLEELFFHLIRDAEQLALASPDDYTGISPALTSAATETL